MSGKIKCQECGNITDQEDVLDAKNPFNPVEFIYGCKKCFSIDRFYAACDFPGCDRNADCGFPSESGYVQSCSDHASELRPKEKDCGR